MLTIKELNMSEMLPLTGEVVFNKLTTPDVFMGTSKYTLTIALDKDGKKLAEKNGLKTNDYEGKTQITSKRKIDFGQPKVYNAEKEEVDASHVSLFGDKVTMLVKKGKAPYDAYTYLERIRVDEKAEGVEEYDQSEF
jgi:hypothetical protein|tara:strand:- start:7848 stop:8258 length:411 start_codon:yes stop_codon:yes gene_type:complete